MKLKGNTVLITGGTSGIGLEMAKQFVRNGNEVIATGRDENKLEKARNSAKGLVTIKSDVGNPDQIGLLSEKVAAEYPDLNVLINNAGIMRTFDLQDGDLSAADLTKEIDVDLKGPIWMTNAFLPLLRVNGEAAIVNVSSGLAFIPLPISPVYCSAKAALHSFTLSLRVQLKSIGIRVFELAPPATDTPMVDGFNEEDMKGISMMSVEDMVETFMRGFEKNLYEIRPGQANQMKFMSRYFPTFLFAQLSKTVDRMHSM